LYAGGPGAPPENADDDVWLSQAGEADWVVIHRDKRIRTRPRERQALIDSRVRSFCMTHSGNATRHETLRLLERRCDAIEDIAATRPGPYIYSVTWAGIREL
jgi:hypothetical protein